MSRSLRSNSKNNNIIAYTDMKAIRAKASFHYNGRIGKGYYTVEGKNYSEAAFEKTFSLPPIYIESNPAFPMKKNR